MLNADRAVRTRWLHFVRQRPEMARVDAQGLLDRTHHLPGNLRYGTSDGREVILVGEVRVPHAGEVPDVAEGLEGRTHPVAEETGDPAAFGELVVAAFEESGLAWKRRDGGWVVPAGGPLVREVAVRPEGAGLRVEAVLVEWDEVGALEREAVARLLCRAQAGLRFCRAELLPNRARLTALLEERDVEGALADSVGGVAAGCLLLAREVGALLSIDVARVYLEFHGAEKGPGAGTLEV
jgi:hypothetical protein